VSAQGGRWPLRLAEERDIPAIEGLIPRSVHALQAPFYSPVQMAAALGPVFGVDRMLIRDGTYFVAEEGGQLAGCGGWSKRRTLFGGDREGPREDDFLNPAIDSARIRAFFIHPEWARRGIGAAILAACEANLRGDGFLAAELVATLAGEPFYEAYGYQATKREALALKGGISLPVVRMRKSFPPQAGRERMAFKPQRHEDSKGAGSG
jgi:GNAT superfamily N-acetyltransferase